MHTQNLDEYIKTHPHLESLRKEIDDLKKSEAEIRNLRQNKESELRMILLKKAHEAAKKFK